VLQVIVLIVSGDDDKLLGDQIFSSGARLLPRGLVVNVWIGLPESVDIFVESPEDLNFGSVVNLSKWQAETDERGLRGENASSGTHPVHTSFGGIVKDEEVEGAD
jgi:hypothetical protein